MLQPGERLVVASHNTGKVWEINQLLAPYGLNAVSAADLHLTEPEETETSFQGNACLKASAAARGAKLPALADDSGLEIEILDGAPGIYSARWAGPGKDFAVAMQKVADEISARGGWPAPGSSSQGPRANFTSVLCLAWPTGETQVFEGKVFGHLVWPPRGGNGFGYDPMFVPDGDTTTFGEMAPEAKYAISHRTRAFEAFKAACLDHIQPIAPPVPIEGRDLAALAAAAASLSTRAELAQFIARLREDLTANGAEWKNATLPAFLEGLEIALASDTFDDDAKWRAVAKLLLAASSHA